MAEDKIERLNSMSEQVNLIRSCMADTFQGILDALHSANPTTGKVTERYENMLKTNSNLVAQALRKLGDLGATEGKSSWLMTPPGGIASHPTLAAAVSSIEDPVSVIEHSLQGAAETDEMADQSRWLDLTAHRSGMVMKYWRRALEPFAAHKKRRLDSGAQDLSELLEICTKFESKEPNMKVKTIEDPLLPGMITAVSFSYSHVFQGQFVFGLPSPNNTVTIERIEMRGADEKSGDATLANNTPRSQYHVFDAIAAQALAAHEHYVRRDPHIVLPRMLAWVAAFGRLFAAECLGCGKMLYADSSRSAASDGPVFLPPTLRTYESLLPFHPQCCSQKDA